ncbi:hypothetical protein BASA81_018343 [Batrachochytrium salamandrivorans]|nr:hypothetical protein BASA81_018343 [Batrachochytrium salamandrivorans]
MGKGEWTPEADCHVTFCNVAHPTSSPVALSFERWGIDFYGPMELGGSRDRRDPQANVRTKAQAEAMRKRNNFDETTPDYFFKVGDMVKMKHHDRLKLEFRWKGPYHVVDVGHPGTYWIMTPQGLRLPNAVNQNDLAPWLAPVVDTLTSFTTEQTGTRPLTGDETSTSH